MAASGTVPELSAFVPEALRVALSARGLRLATPIHGSRHGVHRSRRRGAGLEFRDHRAYVPGDDPRHLDWRAAARSDRLVLRQSEAEESLRVVLALDGSAAMDYGRTPDSKWSMLAAIAAGIAELVGRQGDRLGVLIGRDGVLEDEGSVPTGSRDRWRTMARQLAEPPAGRCPWPELLDRLQGAPARSTIVVVSDFLDPDGEAGPEESPADSALIEGLAGLRTRGHEVALIQLLHPDELAFAWPDQRVLRLEDPRELRSPIEGPAGAMREGYLQALHEHLDMLQRRAEASGLHLVRGVGSEELPETLLSFLAALAGQRNPELGASR